MNEMQTRLHSVEAALYDLDRVLPEKKKVYLILHQIEKQLARLKEMIDKESTAGTDGVLASLKVEREYREKSLGE